MRMGKQKIQRKVNKKGYNHVDDQQSATNSPKRNLPRRRRRNINALSADDYKLRHAIESDGTLTIVDIEADGNCLFRSMSDQLYYDYGANHFEIRQEICDFIEGHKDDFSVFLVLDDKDAGENDEDASDFETYVANMRQDGDWGGHLELVAASRMYRRNITVFSARLDKFTIEHESPKKSAGPDLLLSYHDNDHYNSIRRSSATKPPPPLKTYAPSTIIPSMEENSDDEQAPSNDVEDDEMILEENTTTTNSSCTEAPESITDVEMSETMFTLQSKEPVTVAAVREEISSVPLAENDTVRCLASVEESPAFSNAVQIQTPENHVETTKGPVSDDVMPSIAGVSGEPTMDGTFRVLHI